jgi:hypothetical protein
MSAAIPVVVCFVIERDRHVLLLRRNAWKDEAPGQWETGSVEPGESLADAARREARWVPIAEAPDLPEVPEWVRRSLEALRRAAARSPAP